MGPPRKWALAAAGVLLTLAFAEAARLLVSGAWPWPAPLDLDVGPATGMYLEGFTESEERMPATFRWTGPRAGVSLPIDHGGGRGRLTIRYARFLPGDARVRIFVDGTATRSFTARSGRFRNHVVELYLPAGALRLELLVDDPSPEGLGIAVDWVRVEGLRLELRSWAPRLLLGALLVLGFAAGFTPRAVIGWAGLFAVGQALWFVRAPLAMAHVSAQIGVSAVVGTILVAALVRDRRVALLFLIGLALKGSALFHPSYFYPDVRLHRRHLEAFVTAEGGIVERGIRAQKEAYTAYPRIIAGKRYVFPYSPVFYLPFTLFEREPRGMEALMKHAGLLIAALELPLVFLLARFLTGVKPALWAALLTAFLPPVTSRLLFAQWPTLTGHLLDLVALSCAARLVAAPSALRPLWSYGASAFLSCLIYVSSMINLTLFTIGLVIAARAARLRLALTWLGVGLVTVSLLYLPFVRMLFSEIVPDLLEHGGDGSPGAGIPTTMGRVYLFYGVAYVGFAVCGLWLARRRHVGAFRFLAVYAASFLALLALRATAGMFKDLKELVYIGPLVAITTGVVLDALSGETRLQKCSAAAVAVGLVLFGLAKHGEYLARHTILAGLP